MRTALSRLAAMVCLLICAGSLDFAAAAISREAMADAMARMMEAMGLLGAGAAASVGSVTGMGGGMMNPLGMPGWPAGVGAWPGTGALAQPFMGTSPDGGMTPWGLTPLEGIWEGNDGSLLIVQGMRYRIYAPCQGHLDGDIRVGTDRLELTNRRENFSQEFEFALDQGRLALRDRNSQLFLYRRLVLDGGVAR